MTITFTYDRVRRQAVSSDPGIFVECMSITSEQIHVFCLNWHDKRISISATGNVTGKPPSTRHDWTIIGIGRITRLVPSYHFSSNAEINEVAELALHAMRVMPMSLLPMEQPIITAEFSAELKVFLQRFPHYYEWLRHTRSADE